MLSKLIYSAVKGRLVVLFLSAILILLGLNTLNQVKLDVFPEFAPIKVEIQTEAPGLSTEATEQLVSMPLERALTALADEAEASDEDTPDSRHEVASVECVPAVSKVRLEPSREVHRIGYGRHADIG